MRTDRQIAEELIEELLGVTYYGSREWRLAMNARIELDQCSATSSQKPSSELQCTKFPERFHLSRLS